MDNESGHQQLYKVQDHELVNILVSAGNALYRISLAAKPPSVVLTLTYAVSNKTAHCAELSLIPNA